MVINKPISSFYYINKMKTLIGPIAIAIAIIIGTAILGNAFKNRNASENTISVTGLGTKTFTSDLINWSASFSEESFQLQEAYKALERDRKEISEYLISKGVKSEEIVFSSVDIRKQYKQERDINGNYQQGPFSGYSLSQSVNIESKEVEKIENISRTVTDIINKGIELTSSSPMYFYTKLAEIKHELIAAATKDARTRAEEIAANSKSKLGKLKKGSMGVIQITAPNSSEDYSWGGAFNTSSKEKEASITIRLEYNVK